VFRAPSTANRHYNYNYNASIASTFSVPQQQFADDSQLTFLFPHPISSVESIVLKIVSLPCTPGAVITPFPSNLINLTLFSSEPGNALILSQTSPRSTLRACPNGGPRQATRRHTRQSPVDGQARERSQSHMLLPPTCIATYSISHHRQRCQHDCLLSRRLAARLRQRRVIWHIMQEH